MSKKFGLLLFAITVLSLLGHLFLYPSLPDVIPIHWGVSGQADGFGPKYMDLILAAIPLGMLLLFWVIPKIDPRRENYQKHQGVYTGFIALMTLFLIGVSWAAAAIGMGISLSIDRIICFLLGAVFLITGNYMPRIQSNFTFGIRTPWTIENETVWKKTHRLGGFGFCLGGILFLIAAVISHPAARILPVAFLILMTVSIYVYSYVLFRRLAK